MASGNEIMNWTFVDETDVPSNVEEILVEGEKVEAAYKTLRDVAVITNKRIIIADKQGFTGKKVEVHTVPFRSIIMYSSENTGILEATSEMELYTLAGKIVLKLDKGINIRNLDRIIGQYIL